MEHLKNWKDHFMESVAPCINFQAICKKNWAYISKEKGNPGKNPKEAAKNTNEIFKNTLKGPLQMVLIGPNQFRKDSDLINNFGGITFTPKKKNQTSSYRGAILNEHQWSTLINDVFILGAAYAQKTVYYTGEFQKKDLTNSKDILSGTGREIAILKTLGYKVNRIKDSLFFTPPKKISQIADLKTIWDTIKNITTDELYQYVIT